ncbi:YncE family protein [Micromonospora sp. SL4-19]|uniref:YncE family protein n=1 Tax=Micromonospora sp. SL4-19 TaxID=3399129 RepID=UPI003A4DC6C6
MIRRSPSAHTRGALPRRIAGATAAALAAAAVGIAAPAAAADTSTLLEGVTSARDLVAGDGRVFVAAADRVVVADATGAVTDTLDGMAGAVGLAIDTDRDRLYVALSDSGELAEIDTGSLQVVRRIGLEGHRCPTNLALSGSRIWVGYGCGTESTGGVLTLDVTAAEPTIVGITSYQYQAPRVAVAGNVLATGSPGLSPALVDVYSVDGAQATRRGTIMNSTVANLHELVVTPDGSEVIGAYGSASTHIGYDTTTLAEVRRYGTGPGRPNAVTISPDGRYLAGGRSTSPDLTVHTLADGAPVNRADKPEGELVAGSLAFLGTDVFGLVHDRQGERYHLWRSIDVTLPKSALSLAAPAAATALDPMTVTGRLTLADGAAPGVQPLGVTRILPDDTRTELSATTAADGTFTVTDTPPVSGEIRYEVSWARTPNYQGSQASLTVPVAGRTPTLALTGPGTGDDGRRLQLSGKLTFDGKVPTAPQHIGVTKTIWNNRLNGVTEDLPAVTTDSLGAFTIVDTPTQGGRYVYTVSWDAGSQVYAPASATREITVSSKDSQIGGQVADPAYAGEKFRVTGAISQDVGACQGPATVHVSRIVNGGKEKKLPDVTTDASCAFGFDDTVAVTGQVTYTVSWDGNPTHRGSSGTIKATVQKQPSSIEVTSPDRTLLNGQQAVIDGKVTGTRTGSIGASQTLTVNRVGPDGSSVTLPNVTTAADGTFSLRDSLPTMDASTYPQFTYEIAWAGNATYQGSSASLAFYIVPPDCTC